MKFSGTVKVDALETWDVLQCISRGVVSCLSPYISPATATMRRRNGGLNLTFCLSLPAEIQAGLCWWSGPWQDSGNSATLGRPVCMRMLIQVWPLTLPSVSLCQQELASKALCISLPKTFLFLSSFYLKGRQILNLEATGNLLSSPEKHCYGHTKLCW